MNRSDICDKVKYTICNDRQGQYGEPEDNFAVIAALWEPYIKCKCVSLGADVCILPEDVAMLMALLKIGRIASGQTKEDNYIDLAGYAVCSGEIACRDL